MKYAISYKKDGIWHSNIVDAPSAEVVRKWMQLKKPRAIIGRDIPVATPDYIKPGIPVLSVPIAHWKDVGFARDYRCSRCEISVSKEREFCPRCFAYMGEQNEK